MTNNILGIMLSLISAASWGTGDFFGGFSTRKFTQYAVLVVSAIAGLFVLAVCYLIWPEPFPAFPRFLWAMLAGTFGLVGLGSLYKALSLGHSATVAPTAAVIGASIPVFYGIFTAGFPGFTKIAGFFLAFAGIWLVSRIPDESKAVSTGSLKLAVLAGLGFGGYYIFISIAGRDQTFTPLIISRSTFLLISAIILVTQKPQLGKAFATLPIWLTGIFDTGGNVLYLLAKQFLRLDVAIILSSLYPAVTVLLSWIILREHISRPQWAGVVLSFLAVVLVSI